jgi:hypothetical protein
VPELTPRHQLFEAARHSADLTIDELRISYLALGGALLTFDLKGYLGGLTPMPPGQQDVLACALNERLIDRSDATRVPYLTVLPDRCEEALAMLDQGLDPARPTPQQQQQDRTRPPDPCRPGRELIFERF